MTILVSVVIPTYRRPLLLERCLRALVAQTFHRATYEIIVADDGNDPATMRRVLDWALRTRGLPRVIYAPVGPAHGPAAARNIGWRRATGRIIAFTDDDTIPRADWIAQGFSAFHDNVVAVTGVVHVPLARKPPSDYELDASRLSEGEFVTANCFVERKALVAVNGFDERFTAAWREDSDLFFSLIEAHGRIATAANAVVVHPVRPAHWGVSLRQQRKILFDALLYKKHPRLYRQRIRRGPPWNDYAIVLAIALTLLSLLEGWGVLAAIAALVWAGITTEFCVRRLRHTSHAPGHVLEMIASSILIPPLAVFWRLVGAIRFRAFSFFV